MPKRHAMMIFCGETKSRRWWDGADYMNRLRLLAAVTGFGLP
jgi:hypothetical protein